MRFFYSIVFTLISISANAELVTYGEKDESCVSSTNYNHRIVQKINSNLYELQGDGMSSFPRSLLKTKKAVFDKTGIPVGIGIKKAGTKEMPLENGFSASYIVWEECGLDISLLCTPAWNPTGSWPKKPKDLDCSNPDKYKEKISKVEKKSSRKKK